MLGVERHPWRYASGAVTLILVLTWILALQPFSFQSGAAAGSVSYQQLQAVLAQRCYGCHGERVQMKSVRLDSRQHVKAYAPYMYQQAVVLKLMPLNNATGITDAERALIKAWFEAGARVD